MTEQTTPETDTEEIIHFWDQAPRNVEGLTACGVDIMHTPYTFGSPEQAEVTCPACIAVMPPAPVYRYAVKYVIVDHFGEPLWTGSATATQDKPRPESEADVAVLDALMTSRTIRNSTPPEAPAGRVIVTAAFAI